MSLKRSLRSPLRPAALSPLQRALIAGGAVSAPAFTATMTALTNALGTVTTLAYINPGSGGGGSGVITADFTASRLSGVAPLYVNFDASATTSTASTKPMREVLFGWNFGDTGAGNWSNGPRASSKNLDYGPWNGHTFETPGTYTVTLGCSDAAGNTSAKTVTITVTDPNTVYAGTATVAISHSGNFTGAPSGAQQVTVGSTDMYAAYEAHKGADKRIAFCKADSWTQSAPIQITHANLFLTGYGTGSAFTFGSGTAVSVAPSELNNAAFIARTTGTDARIWGFKLTCQANTGAFLADETINKCLVGRVEKRGGSTGLKGNPGNGGANNVMQGLHYYECLVDEPYAWGISGRMSVYSGFVQGGMSGCYLDNVNDLEQTSRHSFLDRAHINHNTIKRPNATKNVLKIHGFRYPEVALYTEKFLISQNLIDLRGGIAYNGSNDVGDCSIVVGEGGLGDERVRNYIIEDNLTYGCEGQPKGFAAIAANAPGGTVRNNIAYFGLGDGTSSYTATYAYCTLNMVMVATGNTSNPPVDIAIYNNSLYSNLYNAEVANFVRIFSADVDQVDIKNNLWYLPFHNVANSNRTAVYNTVGATNVTTSNNTPEARTSPNFTANPPVALADWKPATGSYAINAGAAVPVLTDFNNAARTGTPDLGAINP